MVSTQDRWIRIFDIPEISKHKNGFTIYKVVSMLYPESCPDAITKVTVWKRFNDFKKLNRELKILHRKLNLKSKFPGLPSKTVFKRFDEETIQERKQSILNFLEFVANNQQLFTSTEFVKFLETSHTPREYLTSNINLIRADLNLPEDPEVCTNLALSDDDKTSDTDSVATLSSLSPSVQCDILPETLSRSKLKKLNSSTSNISQCSSKYSDSISISTTLDSMTLLDGQLYPTPPNTPGSLDEHMQYIVDASVHISLAIELENDKKYEEAFTAYKTAIDILLKYGKDDPNYDRQQMVRYKTEKYLIKAERLYNMYLAPEVKELQQLTNEDGQLPTAVKRPLFDLYKFKVVKIIASGMLVLHSELQQLFYIKVIHKTAQFLNDNLILPENVPYMVKLHYHYNCENALFLVLDYCSGVKLTDYLKNQSTLNDEVFTTRKDNQILKHIQEISDNDSEQSFSDLINDYNSKRTKNTIGESSSDILSRDRLSSDDSYEKVEIEDTLPDDRKPIKNIIDEPLQTCKVEDLVTQSQRLLTSVDTALTDPSTKEKYRKRRLKEIDKENEKEVTECSQRKLSSQMSQVSSSIDLDEFDSSLILPEEIVVKWAAQLLLALEKLHTLGVICRDLQTKNILIDEKGDIVLTYMCNVKEFGDFFCDGINYNLAPEIYTFQEITAATDWWSYGAILYELLVGMPLSEVHPKGINSFSHLKIPKYVSAESRSLLKQLLNYEPTDRLGSGINCTENIKSHPFFHSVTWNILSGHSNDNV